MPSDEWIPILSVLVSLLHLLGVATSVHAVMHARTSQAAEASA